MNKKHTLAYPINNGLPDSALLLPDDIANQLFTPDEMANGEKRCEVKTLGPWQIVQSVKALAIEYTSDRSLLSKYTPDYCNTHATLYGFRTLANAKQSGHDLEGRVSIEGKSRRAFTSSVMFRLSNGRLIDCACLYVCK